MPNRFILLLATLITMTSNVIAQDFMLTREANFMSDSDEISLIEDTGRGIALIEYDEWNNPKRIQFSNGNVTEYIYSADGTKLRTKHYTAVPNILVAMGHTHELTIDEILEADSTDYIGDLVLSNGKPSMYLFNGGYCSLSGALAFHYYNHDHLGNVREVVSEDGSLEQVNNYYPFVAPFSDDSVSAKNPGLQPYKYTGKELDLTHGLNTYDHGARQNYSILSVWDRIDPLTEKCYNISPYAVCVDNPIINLDKNGKWSDPYDAFLYWSITSNSSIQHNENSKSDVYKWTINVFSQDENGDFIITNFHSFNKSLKENASKTLDKYSQKINEISVAASALGDGAETGALVTV